MERLEISELVQKKKTTYSEVERRLLDKLKLPPLGDLKSIPNAPSLFEFSLLTTFGRPLKSSELTELLKDEKLFAARVHSISDGIKNRNTLWYVASGLPLSQDLEKELRTKISGTRESIDESQDADFVIPIRVTLPFGAMPRLETYLAAQQDATDLSVPRARIDLFNKDGQALESTLLSEKETSAALLYYGTLIEKIHRNLEIYKQQFRLIHGLTFEEPISSLEVRNFFLDKLTQRRSKQLAIEKFSHISYETADEVIARLRFSQYKRGLPKQIKDIVDDSEKLKLFFEQTKKRNDKKEGSSSGEPRLISLNAVEEQLTIDSFSVTSEKKPKKLPKFAEEYKARDLSEMNELQIAHLALSNATKSGDWDKAIDVYIKYLEFWPQHLEHRLAAMDLFRRFQKGDLPKLPETILSVASGPHEELRAHASVKKQIPEYEIPKIINLDSSKHMLQKSKSKLGEEVSSSQDVIADMNNIPILDQSVDMVECSSLDNLKTEEQLRTLFVSSLRSLKKDGIIRFMTKQPFSNDLTRVLEQNGIYVIEQNGSFELTDETREKISEKQGTAVLRRVEQKLNRQKYFLAVLIDEVDIPKIDRDLSEIKLYAEDQKFTAAKVKRGLMNSLDDASADRDLEYNLSLVVAQSPLHFLQKKLDPLYLELAISGLKDKLDESTAVKLWRTYSQRAELQPFLSNLIDVVGALPMVQGNLSLDLLQHSDPAVVSYVVNQIRQLGDKYIPAVLSNRNLDLDQKCALISEMTITERSAKSISKYIGDLFYNDDLDAVATLLINLPKTIKLELPVEMRYSKLLANYYSDFSKEVVSEELTDLEVRKLFENEQSLHKVPTSMLIERVLKMKDYVLAKKLYGFLSSGSFDELMEAKSDFPYDRRVKLDAVGSTSRFYQVSLVEKYFRLTDPENISESMWLAAINLDPEFAFSNWDHLSSNLKSKLAGTDFKNFEVSVGIVSRLLTRIEEASYQAQKEFALNNYWVSGVKEYMVGHEKLLKDPLFIISFAGIAFHEAKKYFSALSGDQFMLVMERSINLGNLDENIREFPQFRDQLEQMAKIDQLKKLKRAEGIPLIKGIEALNVKNLNRFNITHIRPVYNFYRQLAGYSVLVEGIKFHNEHDDMIFVPRGLVHASVTNMDRVDGLSLQIVESRRGFGVVGRIRPKGLLSLHLKTH